MAERHLDDFDAFVGARLPSLLRLGRALTGSEQAGADVVQDALERTLQHWSTVGSEDPEGYVRRLILARTASGWRRVRREPSAGVVTAQGALSPYDDPAADARMWSALSRLPRRQRAVIALRYGEELDEADTAELLGVSPGTVRSQTRHALASLRRLVTVEASGAVQEPTGELEERVRRTLRRPSVSGDAERILARVHRGARRRRQRRTRTVVVTALLAVVAAGAVALGVARSGRLSDTVPWPTGSATPDDAPTGGTRGEDPGLADAVGTTGFDGPGPGSMWRVSAEPCGASLCSRIYREGGSAGWEPVAQLAFDHPAGASGDHQPPVESIRVGGDPRNAWAFGLELWSTHDGGASWLREELDGARAGDPVLVEPLGAEVFALQTAPLRMWRSAGTVDLWTPVAVPQRFSSADELLSVGDTLVLRAVDQRRNDTVLVLSDDSGASWRAVPAPCGNEPTPIRSTGSVLMTFCPLVPTAGAPASVLRSTDGERWTVLAGVDAPTPVDAAFPVDAETAFLVTGSQGRLVTADGEVTVDLGTPPGSRGVLGRFVDADYGYLLVDGPRQLLGTENGGRSWAPLA